MIARALEMTPLRCDPMVTNTHRDEYAYRPLPQLSHSVMFRIETSSCVKMMHLQANERRGEEVPACITPCVLTQHSIHTWHDNPRPDANATKPG